jgi:catechol 2,3-dioxygenase-like lactoylglutathione lyase family enzyme
MRIQLSHVNVWVSDQEVALDWYTNKLGFELRDDITVPELGNFRWLTVGPVGQPDIALVLMNVPGEPMFDADTRAQLETVIAKGAAGGLFLTVDDCRAVCAVLRERGVEFTDEPTERPYGIDAGVRDPFGNGIRINQPPG